MAIEFNFFTLLMYVALFIGELIQSFGLQELAFGYYIQILLLCDETNAESFRCMIYTRIAGVCNKSKFFSESLSVLLKALEFSWQIENLKVRMTMIFFTIIFFLVKIEFLINFFSLSL